MSIVKTLICTTVLNSFSINDNCRMKSSEMAIWLVSLAIIICQAGQIESRCPINCQRCSLPNTCYVCEPGYYKSTNFFHEECIQCQTGCTYCSSSTKCHSCKDGYGLSNGVCQLCSENCGTCFHPGTCNRCKRGYYKNEHTDTHNAVCIKCYHGCTTCSSMSECISCKEDFVLSNGWCHPCSSNCDKCSQPNKCDTCKPGFYVTSNQYCYQCPERCSTCLNWTDCQSCINGYYLQDSNCIKCPETCSTCSSQYKCSSCQTGFYLDNDFCVNCIKGCASCEKYYNCKQCLPDYYLTSSGRCEECPKFCINCSGRSTCDLCIPGYFGNICEKTCSVLCNRNQCRQFDGLCIDDCVTGYYKDNAHCKSCPDGCHDRKCSQYNGKCSEGCVSGFYGPFCNTSCSERCHEKLCNQQSGECMKGCIDGYYGETCQRCSELCLNEECETSSGRCTSGCVEGYYENGSKCQKCSDKCKTCSSLYLCTSCNEGWYTQNCNTSCPYCSSGGCSLNDGLCLNGCKDGHFQDTTGCLPCPDKCSKCNSTKLCKECQSGYFGIMCEQQCPYNCLTCDDNDNCRKCRAGYFGKSCDKKCSQTCINRCKKKSGVCKDCIDGYFKAGDQCLPCPNGCISCYSNKNCSRCKTGHYLSLTTGLCPACGQECMKCASPDACIRCFPEHGNLNGTCVFCNKCINVAECSRKTGCSQCQDGYWGTYCTDKCGPTCTLCNKDTGECINCTHHTFGGFCELSCSSNCHKTSDAVLSCFQENGTCRYGCVRGFTGHNCTIEIPTSYQRFMVLAISGSALGGSLLVTVTISLIMLFRRRRKQVTISHGVDSNCQHVRCSIRNPTYDDVSIGIDINLARSETNSDAADHVYSVAQTAQLKQKCTNERGQSGPYDNVYEVTSTERQQVKNQWRTKTGDDRYNHINHMNKMGLFVIENQMDWQTGYDHVKHELCRPCNEGTYDIAGRIQSPSLGRRQERMLTFNSPNQGDESYNKDDICNHTNQRFATDNADHASYNTESAVMLPQIKKDCKSMRVEKDEQEGNTYECAFTNGKQ